MAIDAGRDVAALIDGWEDGLRAFMELRAAHLFY